jgi:predicted nucleic acid-binding Zn ribbon protein
MTPLKRPEKAGLILKELLRNLGIDKRIEEYEAYLSWEHAVGEKLAPLSRAKSVKDGVLLVEVKGCAWMSEIKMMKKEILEKLNRGKERGRIRDIVLVQWRGRNG